MCIFRRFNVTRERLTEDLFVWKMFRIEDGVLKSLRQPVARSIEVKMDNKYYKSRGIDIAYTIGKQMSIPAPGAYAFRYRSCCVEEYWDPRDYKYNTNNRCQWSTIRRCIIPKGAYIRRPIANDDKQALTCSRIIVTEHEG